MQNMYMYCFLWVLKCPCTATTREGNAAKIHGNSFAWISDYSWHSSNINQWIIKLFKDHISNYLLPRFFIVFDETYDPILDSVVVLLLKSIKITIGGDFRHKREPQTSENKKGWLDFSRLSHKRSFEDLFGKVLKLPSSCFIIFQIRIGSFSICFCVSCCLLSSSKFK